MPFYYRITLGFKKGCYYSFVAKVYRAGILLFVVCFWFITRAITFFFGIAIVQAQTSLLWWNIIPLADLHLLCAHKGKEQHGWLKTDIIQLVCYWLLPPHDSPALQSPFHLPVVSLLHCMCSCSVCEQLNTTRTIPNIQEQLLALNCFTDELYSLYGDSYRRKMSHGWMRM